MYSRWIRRLSFQSKMTLAMWRAQKEGKHVVFHKTKTFPLFCFFSLIDKFDKMARDALKNCPYTISLPDSGTVFDYYVDCKIGAFMHWREKQPEKNRKVVASYTIIPEVGFLETLSSPSTFEIVKNTFLYWLSDGYYFLGHVGRTF